MKLETLEVLPSQFSDTNNMPYINLFIPRIIIPPPIVWGSGSNYYDTFDLYSVQHYDDSINFNLNIFNSGEIYITGKVNGKLFYPVYYGYDDFERYETGYRTCITGINILTGYHEVLNTGTRLFYPVNYIYDNFELYTTGSKMSLTSGITVLSGYYEFFNKTTGTPTQY